MDLETFVSVALQSVPFYRQRYPKEASLHELGVLSRTEVVEHGVQLVRDEVDQRTLVESRSSGTTGQPVVTWQHPLERVAAGRALWRRRGAHGVVPADQCARFVGYGPDFLGEGRTVVRRRQQSLLSWLSLDIGTLRQYANEIDERRCKWIQGAPSAVALLARRILEDGTSLRTLKLIELTGEYISPSDRSIIEAAFPTATVASYYGTREVWPIAYECPQGVLHICQEVTHVETTRGVKDVDLLTVTGLAFAAMPLMRYQLTDVAVLDTLQSPCSCGETGPVILELIGRVADYITTAEGEPLPAQFFHLLFSQFAQSGWGSAVRYQVHDATDRHLTLRIEPATPWPDEIVRALKERVENRTGREVRIEFDTVFLVPGKKFSTIVRG